MEAIDRITSIRGVSLEPRSRVVLADIIKIAPTLTSGGSLRRIMRLRSLDTADLLIAASRDYEVAAEFLSPLGLDTDRLTLAARNYHAQVGSRSRLQISDPDFTRASIDQDTFSDVTPRLGVVLNNSAGEATRLRDASIHPRHLLVSLTREEQSIAAEVIAGTNIGMSRLRSHVLGRLGGIADPFQGISGEQGEGVRPQDSLDILRSLVDSSDCDPSWRAKALLFIEQVIKTHPSRNR